MDVHWTGLVCGGGSVKAVEVYQLSSVVSYRVGGPFDIDIVH